MPRSVARAPRALTLATAPQSATANTSVLFGYVAGRALGLPIVVVGLAAIAKSNRNLRSLAKAFAWTSLVILLSLLGPLGSAIRGE